MIVLVGGVICLYLSQIEFSGPVEASRIQSVDENVFGRLLSAKSGCLTVNVCYFFLFSFRSVLFSFQ